MAATAHIPTGPFWDTLEGNEYQHLSRSFSKVFPTSKEQDSLDLNPDTDTRGRLLQLYKILTRHEQAHPLTPAEALSPADWDTYSSRVLLLGYIEATYPSGSAGEDTNPIGADIDKAISRNEKQRTTYAARYKLGIDPRLTSPDDLGTMNSLVVFYCRRARKEDLVEAERIDRALIVLMKAHPNLGEASPQVLGSLRNLIEVLGKQGRFEEALGLVPEAARIIGLLKGTKWEGEVEEETRELTKVERSVVELKEEKGEN